MSALVVWRLCSANYGDSAFSGEGARLYDGRWSPRGVAVAYAAESRALAVVEVLANVDDAETLFDVAWVFVAAELPLECIEKPARFPGSWRQFPHSCETQAVGAEWARAGRSVALRLPSAVVPGEFNFLVNPAHPDFKHVKVARPVSFSFDPRLTA